MLIYLTENLVNGKLYIGQTNENRSTYLGSGLLILKAITKYGKKNFKKTILVKCSLQEELDEQEIFWIDRLNTLVPNGYNIGLGGNGKGKTSDETKKRISESEFGKRVSIESKEKMSLSQKQRFEDPNERKKYSTLRKGLTYSDETKKRMSDAQIKRYKDPKERKKISNARKGCKHTEETKRKIGDASKEYWRTK